MNGNRVGWVPVQRALLGSDVWLLPDGQRIVYLTLLLLANHAATTWTWRGQQYSAQPGQLVTSSERLAAAAGVTRQTVRSALRNLAQLGALTNESTKSGMLITLSNWGLRQSDGEKSTNISTNTTPNDTATNQHINQQTVENQPPNQPTNQPTKKSPNPLPIGACANQAANNQPTNQPTYQPTNSGKSTNISTTNNNTNTITTTNNGHCPVDNNSGVLARLTTIIGTDAAQRWISGDPNGGADYCEAQLALMDRQRDTIRNQRQWLLSALQNNWANWKPPAPRPDPNCPDCGGTGRRTDWGVYPPQSGPCTCVPRPAAAQQPPLTPPPAADPARDPAAKAAALAAQLQA